MADVSNLDLHALIRTWEDNPNLLGFRDAVLSCLTELQARRAAEAKAVEALREILDLKMGRGDGVVGDYIEEIRDIARAALGARND